MTPKLANISANIALEWGIGNVGSVTAIATARHAAALGAGKLQFGMLESLIQGYAVAKRTKVDGARKMANKVPIP